MTVLKRLVTMVTLATVGALSLVSSGDQVLFWMLDDPWIGGTECKASEVGSGIDSARVVATLGEGSPKIYLDLYYQDGGQWVVDPTAVPRIDTAEVVAGRIVGGYARASLETTLGSSYALYSFAIELGTWGGDDGNKWLAWANSESATYAQLQDYISFQVDVPTATPWTAGGYWAVPEPSSALLILLGGSLLALRRRRRIGA